jgi:RNA polymerase sigma-70 factor (ECF subfamily)
MQTSDDELMQEVKRDNISAFDILVRRWEHKLFNFIYKITGNFEITKDIRQEVLLRVYKSAKRYRSEGQFQTWLYRIAVNYSLDELKKLKRHRFFPLTIFHQQEDGESMLIDSVLTDPNQKPDESLQQDEIAKHVQDALRSLPEEQRIVIVLRHYEDLKLHEIASILNCPLGTVKSRIRLGSEQLRGMLKNLC